MNQKHIKKSNKSLFNRKIGNLIDIITCNDNTLLKGYNKDTSHKQIFPTKQSKHKRKKSMNEEQWKKLTLSDSELMSKEASVTNNSEASKITKPNFKKYLINSKSMHEHSILNSIIKEKSP